MKVSDLVEPIDMFPGDKYVGIVIEKIHIPGSSVRLPRNVKVM